MKKLVFILSLLMLGFTIAHSQTMSIRGGKLYYGDLKINLQKAKDLSLEKHNTEAYESFAKARKIRGWNLFWAGFGGWEVGAGSINLLINGKPVGALDMLIGGLLVGMTFKREKRAQVYINKGIDQFNQVQK